MDTLHTKSDKEIDRLQITAQLKKTAYPGTSWGAIRIKFRQVKRLWRRYKLERPGGLVNIRRGKPNHNRLSEEVKQKALDLILELLNASKDHKPAPNQPWRYPLSTRDLTKAVS